MRHLVWTAKHLFELYAENGVGALDAIPESLKSWLREVYTEKVFVECHDKYESVRPFATEFDEAHTALEVLVKAGL